MANLESPLSEQIAELRKTDYKLWLEKDFSGQQAVLLKAWELLPEPKVQWDESYLLAKDLVDNYLELNSPTEAKKWSDLLLECDPERKSHGSRELYAGMVAFELGNLDEAMSYFHIV